MNKLKPLFLLLFVNFFALLVSAQGDIKPTEDSSDFMRSNGKIYVVVAVIVIIVIGLFLYLYNLDKKISALEKQNKS